LTKSLRPMCGSRMPQVLYHFRPPLTHWETCMGREAEAHQEGVPGR